MSTRLSIVSNARHVTFALVLALVAAATFTSAGQQAPAVPPETPAATAAAATPAPDAPAAELSEAEQHFRAGVSLYNRGLFLEALSEFNRALALQPEHENAKLYRDKANAKLAITSAGGDAAATATFETVDPEALAAPSEGPQLSAEEMKIKRVAELLKKANLYLENLRYEQAAKLFEEVLLIAPDNSRAREGLHLATVGASRNEIDRAEKKIQEDRSQIRKYIEQSKQLPEGADPTGIKEFRISVPIAEEEYVAPETKSEIEEVLDSFVSIEFENIHLIEILDFISESYDVNIVPDDRVIMRPQKAAPAPAAAAAPVPGAFPGAPPGARPGGPGAGPVAPGGGRNAAPARAAAPAPAPGGAASALTAMGDFVTDGMVPYIALQNVPLRDALKALLRPLNLEFAVQPGFIWISTPEKIRLESFEPLETRYYELRNAGAETLFKIVLRNPGGGGGMMGGMMGGMGGGMMGGYGGGRMGGMSGGYGGMGGGYGGMGGGYGGGMGGMSGGYGGGMGGGYGGGMGGGMMGGGYGGGMMGGGMGGYGGGMGGYGGGMRGGMMGGGMMGGGMGGVQIQNISQLFGSISDLQVGETPAIIGTAGLSTGGTGNVGSARVGGAYGGGANAANGPAGVGTSGRSDNLAGDEPEIVRLLRLLVDDVYEPNGTEPISRMIYVPHNNQLIVVNTPTNLAKLEKQLAELDVTPKQVSIEAKFLTIKAEDLDKIGFKWNIENSDLNGRNREISELQNSTTPASYDYDINGDGIKETIPFYTKPNGANVITNTVTSAVMEALANPGPTGNFSLSGIITQNEDGDKLSVVMDYLDTLEESELLSAPRVTTMNRKPAVIADLTTEYFVASVHSEIVTTEGTLGGSGRLGYVQRIQPQPFNFGITLSVTPQISGSDQVRLWLNPQVTTRGLEKKFTQRTVIEGNEIEDEITLPNTSTQAVWTNVIVHDGDTLVLGGLVSDQTISGQHKLPYLADIPVVGFFFRGKSKQVKQSSLLIFVTPTIIDTTGARYYEADTGPAIPPAGAPVPVPPDAESTLQEEATPLAAPEATAEPEALIEPLEKAPEASGQI